MTWPDPQRREGPVERQAHVRVAPEALEQGRPLARDRDRAGASRGARARTAIAPWPIEPPACRPRSARIAARDSMLLVGERRQRGRGEAHAAGAHHQRALEGDGVVECRRQARAGADAIPSSSRSSPASRQADRAREAQVAARLRLVDRRAASPRACAAASRTGRTRGRPSGTGRRSRPRCRRRDGDRDDVRERPEAEQELRVDVRSGDRDVQYRVRAGPCRPAAS